MLRELLVVVRGFNSYEVRSKDYENLYPIHICII